MEGLHRLGIEGLSLHNVLKLNTQPSEADYAVDIRSPAIAVGVLSGPGTPGQVFCYIFFMRGKLLLPALLLASNKDLPQLLFWDSMHVISALKCSKKLSYT